MRWAVEQDYDDLAEIMFAAIHATPSPYSEAERAAWRTVSPSGEEWNNRLLEQAVIIAEVGPKPLGFMSLRNDGYIDLAFILAEARGQGLFRQLYAQLENKARKDGMSHLTTHASLSAEGPFLSVGFVITDFEAVIVGGQTLRRTAMEKHI
ncbi:MAG: GNAT family N-acetyltransferase [Pseudomonadota bacterium]